MNDILIKYGIPISVLSKAQSTDFCRYTKEAQNRDFNSFNSFLEIINKQIFSVNEDIDSIHKQTHSTISEALRLTEKIIADSNTSLLSAFGTGDSKQEINNQHTALLLGLSEIISCLNILFNDCAKIITETNNTLIVDFKLRYAALCEFAPDSDVCLKYSEIIKNCKNFDAPGVSRAQKYSVLISDFLTVTTAFCQDADAAFKCIKTNRILYSQTARNYIIRAHSISLKLNEIKGDSNAKI